MITITKITRQESAPITLERRERETIMKKINRYFNVASGTGMKIEGSNFYVNAGRMTNRKYTVVSDEAFVAKDYLVLEYSAFGIAREKLERTPFISGITEGAVEVIAHLNDAYIDGKRHRMTVKLNRGVAYSSYQINLRVVAPSAYLKIFELYTCDENELPTVDSMFPTTAKRGGFSTVNLDSLYNSTADAAPAIIDGGIDTPRGETTLFGIPFEFSRGDKNEISPSPAPIENAEEVINFGVKTTRGLCRPNSREDEISVPIAKSAKEIVFVTRTSGSLHERWAFGAPDATILGSAMGEIMMPLSVKDVEQFRVKIVYENGLLDTAFPYNVKDGNYRMTGAIGVYAVAASNYPIKEVVFENRMLATDVSILAVSLNESGEALIPAIPEKKICEPKIAKENGIKKDGNKLTFSAGALEMVLDISAGLCVTSFKNGYASVASAGGHLLKIRTPKDAIVSDFETNVIEISDSEAKIKCVREALDCTVTVGIENDTLNLSLSAKNTREEELSCGIIFPALENICYTDFKDTWYLFPKYQNALGNGHISVYEESAPSFPMQFFDIFSNTQSAGLGFLTKEQGIKVRKYALDKTDSGVNCYVEYPSMYMKLGCGEVFESTPAEIFVHRGDWHFAFEKYRNWLKSWYKPVKSQNKDWYRKSFWLIAEITDFFETGSFTRFPIWYEKDKKKHNFIDIMEEQKSLYGSYPDILHMWGWTWNEKSNFLRWGHFADEDYDMLGGLEPWKAALRECSEKTGANISLYLHPTLLTRGYPEEKEYMPELLVERADGKNISINGEDEHMRMCHANKRWRAHVIDMYRRVWRETGIKILYVDEFSLRIGNRCYGKNHGHPVPSNLLEVDRDFISELRGAIPEDVVLYGEYAAVDVNAKYIDCNISYHILDTIRDMIETSWIADDDSGALGRPYFDLYRFAFPGIVQLVLPMAMRHQSWQPLKSTFFNGEAIYDSFWDAEESRGREFMGKSFRIKKKYGDLFASDSPSPAVDTPLTGVYCNVYPKGNEVLYAFYNRANKTMRGPLLDLPYEEGVSYYDAWNERPCETERRGDRILILGSVDAQDVGCIVSSKSN